MYKKGKSPSTLNTQFEYRSTTILQDSPTKTTILYWFVFVENIDYKF